MVTVSQPSPDSGEGNWRQGPSGWTRQEQLERLLTKRLSGMERGRLRARRWPPPPLPTTPTPTPPLPPLLEYLDRRCWTSGQSKASVDEEDWVMEPDWIWSVEITSSLQVRLLVGRSSEGRSSERRLRGDGPAWFLRSGLGLSVDRAKVCLEVGP